MTIETPTQTPASSDRLVSLTVETAPASGFTKKSLDNWVQERGGDKEGRRKRDELAKALLSDEKNIQKSKLLSNGDILKRTQSSRSKIEKIVSNLGPRLGTSSGGPTFITGIEVEDALETQSIANSWGEHAKAKYRLELWTGANGEVIARKVKVDSMGNANQVVEEATIMVDGRTRLTIQPSGYRFENYNGRTQEASRQDTPNIRDDSNLQLGAVTLFNQLADQVTQKYDQPSPLGKVWRKVSGYVDNDESRIIGTNETDERATSYPGKYGEIIGDEIKLAQALRGSRTETTSLEELRDKTFFLSRAVKPVGSLLQIDSGNGFLGASIAAWCGAGDKLVTWGVDTDSRSRILSRDLFGSDGQVHVVTGDYVDALESPREYSLPAEFTNVLWVADPHNDFSRDSDQGNQELQLIKKLWDRVDGGGQLVIGFLDTNDETNERQIAALEQRLPELGITVTRKVVNGRGRPGVALCLEKTGESHILGRVAGWVQEKVDAPSELKLRRDVEKALAVDVSRQLRGDLANSEAEVLKATQSMRQLATTTLTKSGGFPDLDESTEILNLIYEDQSKIVPQFAGAALTDGSSYRLVLLRSGDSWIVRQTNLEDDEVTMESVIRDDGKTSLTIQNPYEGASWVKTTTNRDGTVTVGWPPFINPNIRDATYYGGAASAVFNDLVHELFNAPELSLSAIELTGVHPVMLPVQVIDKKPVINKPAEVKPAEVTLPTTKGVTLNQAIAVATSNDLNRWTR